MDVSRLRVSKTCQVPQLLRLYEKYLPQTGTFVEVGAFDGESHSNTSCLADAGWVGYYVEPVPGYFRSCVARHARNQVKVFNYAISDTDVPLEIHVGGALTTASKGTLSAYKEITWSKNTSFHETLTIQAMTLDSFLELNAIATNFDLLVVDVEGFEENVFKGFRLNHWLPGMMIVELNDYHPDFNFASDLQSSARNVRQTILAGGYQQVYADAINSVFVRA